MDASLDRCLSFTDSQMRPAKADGIIVRPHPATALTSFEVCLRYFVFNSAATTASWAGKEGQDFTKKG